ncbi:MAG: hypothetical protein FJ386_03230 [Verrucomicrobia bacterium]|nr:hypothetical protein [Verrucomicrobiota bacterium]
MKRLVFLAVAILAPATTLAQPRDNLLTADRAEAVAAGSWIYNDLPRGFAEAARTGKPMLVVFR